MKIAIMQPYLFPYIGYFQLLNAADKFVCYDDVAFIKQGWINRNNILLNGKSFLFTVPLKDASSFKSIRETHVGDNPTWKAKLLKTFEQAYKKAPYYDKVIELIKEVIIGEEKLMAATALESLKAVCSYVEIKTAIVESSIVYSNNHLQAQARVIDICRRESATEYLNPIGGQQLYQSADFKRENIKLGFIKTGAITYRQFGGKFVPNLSIIDAMMFNSPAEIKRMLGEYEIL